MPLFNLGPKNVIKLVEQGIEQLDHDDVQALVRIYARLTQIVEDYNNG